MMFLSHIPNKVIRENKIMDERNYTFNLNTLVLEYTNTSYNFYSFR